MNQEPRKMATSPESIGQQIVNLITTSNLVTGCSGFCLWVPNAASQLDALIASHEAELLRQLAAATEAADTASAEAAALDILLADVHYDLKLDNEQDAMERIERFRSRNDHVHAPAPNQSQGPQLASWGGLPTTSCSISSFNGRHLPSSGEFGMQSI